jgi:biotin transport system permease protein
VLVWHLPPLGLAVVAAGLAGLFAATPLRRGLRPGMLRGHAWFVLVWVMLRFALACLGPAETSSVPVIGNNGGAGASGVFDALRLAWPDGPLLAHAARESALLGTRLALLIGIGLALALAASPRALGLALVWLLRPVLGARAWQPALGVALMVHFLPMAQGTFTQISRAANLRGPLPLRRRAVLLPAAVLRILGQRTWTQTVAVAARGLDRPEAWRPDFPFRPARWAMALLLAGLGVGMTFLPG